MSGSGRGGRGDVSGRSGTGVGTGTGEDGFTLLEVMISIAILSLGLATVFGSSIMAARGTAHARMVTQAGLLAQCRMSAVEAYLRQNQLPETDQNLDDPPETGGERCCEGAFTCVARVEKIELPQPTDLGSRAGDRLLNSATGAARGQTFGSVAGGGAAGALGGDGGLPASGAGSIGALAGALNSLGAGGNDPLGGVAGSLLGGATGGAGGLAGAGAPNLQGMAQELLTGIYPTLKPLLEGAIRKVTVTVRWNEGSREFTVDVVQYVTNPGQTMRSGDQLNALERMLGGGAGAPPGGPGGATPPANTPQQPTAPRSPFGF